MANSDRCAQMTVCVDGVSKQYGGLTALRTLSIDIPIGSLCVVTGANGSGKSTLLRLLCGVEDPSTGTVLVNGRRADSRSREFNGAVTRLLDAPVFFPFLTALDHLDLIARTRGEAVSRDTLLASLDSCGLRDLADSSPALFSEGQQRRLLLACVLQSEATVRVIDEPEARLDLNGQAWIRDRLVDRAHSHGETIVVATHDPQLRAIADIHVDLD